MENWEAAAGKPATRVQLVRAAAMVPECSYTSFKLLLPVSLRSKQYGGGVYKNTENVNGINLHVCGHKSDLISFSFLI